jgi:hypothetical protein
MVTFMSRYPDGVAGMGLLLLRISCALGAFSAHLRLLLPMRFSALAFTAAIVIALTLALGFGARAAALLLLGATLSAPLAANGSIALIIAHAGCCAALALLGPGAYSIDANVYGRRVIRFESRPRHRKKGE